MTPKLEGTGRCGFLGGLGGKPRAGISAGGASGGRVNPAKDNLADYHRFYAAKHLVYSRF